MRHRGGADLTLDGARAQITETDVAPNVPTEVDEYSVVAARRLGVFGNPVVRFDLRRVNRILQTERADEAGADLWPVEIRVSNRVRVEISDGAVELAEDWHGREAARLRLEPGDDVGELLAEGRR